MDDIARLKEQVGKHPDSILFVKLAEACHRVGRLKEAISALSQGLDRKPTFTSARALLGRYYTEAGLYPDAIRELRRVLVTSAEDVSSLMCLADACRLAGMNKEALVYYRKSLELSPDEKRADIYIRQLTGKIAPEEAALEELALPPELEVSIEEALEEKTMIMQAPVLKKEAPQPPKPPTSPKPSKQPEPRETEERTIIMHAPVFEEATEPEPYEDEERTMIMEAPAFEQSAGTEDRTIIMHAPVFEEALEPHEDEERTMIMEAPAFEQSAWTEDSTIIMHAPVFEEATEPHEDEERTMIMQAPESEEAPALDYDENPDGDLVIGEIELGDGEEADGVSGMRQFGEESGPGDVEVGDGAGAMDDYEVGEIALGDEAAVFDDEFPSVSLEDSLEDTGMLEHFVPHEAERAAQLSDKREAEHLNTVVLAPEAPRAFPEVSSLEDTGMFEQFAPHEAEAITTLSDEREVAPLDILPLVPEAPRAFPEVSSLEDTGMFEKFAPHEAEMIMPLSDEREVVHIETEDLAEEAVEEAEAEGQLAPFSLDDTGALMNLARAASAEHETVIISPEPVSAQETMIITPAPVAEHETIIFASEPVAQEPETMEQGTFVDEAAISELSMPEPETLALQQADELEIAEHEMSEFSFSDVTAVSAGPKEVAAPEAAELAEAELLIASGDYSGAMDVYKRALLQNPDNGQVIQKTYELKHLIKVQGFDGEYQAHKLEKFLGAIHRRRDEFFGNA